jgi:FkbM family methyltransferase
MPNLRRRFKRWLYSRCPGFAGAFPYYGTRVYFPPDSLIFHLACEQGIYEAANQRLLLSALRPDTTVFDIGANIGLLSVPLLAAEPRLRVISIEPSPKTFACLRRTVAESAWCDRWSALPVATGDHEGEVDFFCAVSALSAFDGLRDTHRAGTTTKITVPLTTLDKLWADAAHPSVCAVKIDVEGAEAPTLRGARECLRRTRAAVLVEWNAGNLGAHDCPPETLLELAAELDYDVFASPGLSRTVSPAHLRAQMEVGESFALLPKP